MNLESHSKTSAFEIYDHYVSNLALKVKSIKKDDLMLLVNAMSRCYEEDKTIYICGNGGSAANAIHAANDLSYTGSLLAKKKGKGIKCEALSANSSVLTCIANDISYADIYSNQLEAKGTNGDLLITLSGSGNSENIVKAIHQAKVKSMETVLIVGFDGGKAKSLVDISLHSEINDMQIAEDIQLVIIHLSVRIMMKMIL